MDYRGKTPKKLGLKWSENNNEIPAISAKNIKNGELINIDKSHYGDDKLYKVWMKDGSIEINDILLTSEAPLGESYLVTKPLKAILSQRTFLLRPNIDIISPWYFFALTQSKSFQKKLFERATGTTVIGIKQKDLRKIEIDLPNKNDQRKIGNYFRVITEKISLNKQINDNLSKFRKIQYKKMIQQNRIEKVKLPQLFKISYGKNLAKSEVTSSGIPVFGANGLIGYTTKSSIINGPTVTITSRGSDSGYVNYLDVGEAFLTNNLLYLHDKENFGLSFSFETIQLCKPSQFVTGSAQPQLTIKNLSQAEVIIPTDINKIYNFKKQMRPIESTIKNNNFENIKLEKLKNMLLKKYF